MNKRLTLINQIKGLLNGTATIRPALLITASNGLLYDDRDIEAVTHLMRFNSERELEYWKNSAGLNHASYFVSNNPPAVTCILKTEYVPLSGAIPKQGKALAHTPASNPAYNEHQQKLAALAALYVNNPPKYFVIERRPFSSLGEPIESNGRMSIKVGGL